MRHHVLSPRSSSRRNRSIAGSVWQPTSSDSTRLPHRVVVLLVHREGEHARIRFKNKRGAIPVVDIEIDESRPALEARTLSTRTATATSLNGKPSPLLGRRRCELGRHLTQNLRCNRPQRNRTTGLRRPIVPPVRGGNPSTISTRPRQLEFRQLWVRLTSAIAHLGQIPRWWSGGSRPSWRCAARQREGEDLF